MPGSRLWSRFWHCWLTDVDIQALSWELKGRWAELFLFVGEHGQGGDLYLPKGLRSLPPRWTRGVTTHRLRHLLLSLPGVVLVDDDPPREGVHIVFRNWRKYQEWTDKQVRRGGNPKYTTSRSEKPPTSAEPDSEVNPDNPYPFSRKGGTSIGQVIPWQVKQEREQAIGFEHPDWTPRQIEDEALRQLGTTFRDSVAPPR